MERLLQNTRVALRTLLRTPGFSTIAVLTLGLGIGATTAIFSVVNSVLLEPLAYPQASRLVHLEHPVPGLNAEWKWGLSEAGYFYLREHNRSFEELGVFELWNLTLAGDGTAEQTQAAAVSASLFGVLGGRAHLGRLLLPEDNERPQDGTRVAVLGYDFWRTRFGADPSVVGSTIEIEGNPVEVVGVSAPGLQLPDQRTDLWVPVQISPTKQPVNWHRFQAVGRLREGVAPQAAQVDLARLIGQFSEAMPQAYGDGFMENSQFTIEVEPLRSQVIGDIARVLWVLLAAVGLVLLIACANVANLFLLRMEARRREVALRTALGASRGDLAWRYLTESVVVALLAGALALVLASAGIQLLLSLSPEGIPRLAEIGLGWKGVAFAALVALLTGALLGVLPLLRSGENLSALREGSRGMTASPGQHSVRAALVIGEIALALVLLAGAGLMLRSVQQLRSVHPGVDPRGVLTLDLSLPAARYRGYEPVSRFYQELSMRVAALPGVVTVGATQQLPLKSPTGCALVFTDDPAAQERNSECFATTTQVTPDYFRAMGIPVRGRIPSWSDVERRSGEVVVSQAFAERLWPGQDPIGRGVKGNGSQPPFYRIAGVASDVRASGLDQPPLEQIYFPMLPIEGAPLWSPPNAMTLVVRSATAQPEKLTPAIRQVLAELDPTVPVGSVQTMEQVIARSMVRSSFTMLLLSIAAGVALVLGVVGLYGVVSYVVEQRRGEIGIRMALGAGAGRIAGMVVGQSARLAVAGIVLGLLVSLGVTRVLQSLLFETSPTDPLTLAAVSLLLIGVALLAAYLPARRATRVDPMIALRSE